MYTKTLDGQHYYRESEEHNYNGCKLLVKKDDMLDSLDDKGRTNGINFTIRKVNLMSTDVY